jgi:hypothetical protein
LKPPEPSGNVTPVSFKHAVSYQSPGTNLIGFQNNGPVWKASASGSPAIIFLISVPPIHQGTRS